ncbi:hypothetical protein FBU30_003995 [Linnemannia zychae]|nr:hypothetical protein FBU30_003995 [Linnemannia zychae]
MRVSKAYELINDCKAIKCVDPQKEGPCEIDGTAVSYMRFKTTEGRLLLKQLKKMAKEDVIIDTLGSVLHLAHWDQGSWSLPPTVATMGLTSDLSAMHLSTASTSSFTTLPISPHPPTDVYHKLNSARDVVWPLLANALNKMYERFYKKSEDVIHYDVLPTTQKAFAHERRKRATKKQILKLSEYLRFAETRLLQMEAKPNLSNSRVIRFKSFFSKVLFPYWIRTRGIDPRASRAVVNELHESHGWKVHVRAGQADICIGKKAQESPDLIVVSTDSDLMFVGAEWLFRLILTGTRFYCYPIKDIILHCGPETSEEWAAAAVVSQNDYDPSFCKRKNIQHIVVEKSLDSFVKLDETLLSQYTEGDDEIDESIRRIIYRVEALTLRSRRSHKSRTDQGSTALMPINVNPVQETKDNDNIVEMLALPQLQSRLTTTPHMALPVVSTTLPTGTAARNVERFVISKHANGYQKQSMNLIWTLSIINGEQFSKIHLWPQIPSESFHISLYKPAQKHIACKHKRPNHRSTWIHGYYAQNLTLDENTVEGDDSDDSPDRNYNDDSDDDSDDNSDDGTNGDSKSNSNNDLAVDGRGSKENRSIDAKHPRKRKRKRVIYTKSSRKARDADNSLNENVVPRKINPTNLMADVVACSHPMRSMRPGRIELCIIHSLKASFPRMSDQDRSLLASHLYETMNTMARVHSDLLRESLSVTSLYIAKTFRKFSAIVGELGREHGAKRIECFNIILLKGKRESFILRLLNRLIKWGIDDSYFKKTTSPALAACDEVFQEYLQLTSQREAPPFRQTDRDVCDGSL